MARKTQVPSARIRDAAARLIRLQPARRILAARSVGQLRWAGRTALIEIGLIVMWALWIGRSYLNLDPHVMPIGREFAMAVQPQFIWETLMECGSCMLWNGFVNGGNPAFVELHGVVLHPLAIVSVLLVGAVNAGKLLVVAGFALAGVAQWWLARVLRLGLPARMWSAAMAVTGGHLAGRMEIGVIGVVLSTASASLILAPALHLALYGRRRSAIVLAVTLALLIVSGQGYLQLGVVFGLLPALGIVVFDEQLRPRAVWKEFALAGGLSLLMAGVFLVPLAHFWPNIGKDAEQSFISAQPLQYVPLSLVIGKTEFYRTADILYNLPYPYLYVNYISCLPLVLAAAAWRLVPRQQLRVLVFFLVAIMLVYLCASALTFRLLHNLVPTFAAGIRNPSLIAGLAVPCILALAAWGLDLLLRLPWPRVGLLLPDARGSLLGGVSLSWLVLGAALLWSLGSTYTFSQGWLATSRRAPHVDQVLEAMTPPSAAWLEPPFGEHYWSPPFLTARLKLTTFVRPWQWRDRVLPKPRIRASRHAEDMALPGYEATVGDVHLFHQRENDYAYVETAKRRVPCEAHALGGTIDVACTTSEPGRLVVQENAWSGWTARRDGVPVDSAPEPWLTVPAPAGAHRYAFRYRPWDVWLGLALTLGGIGLAVWLWLRAPAGEPYADGDGRRDHPR